MRDKSLVTLSIPKDRLEDLLELIYELEDNYDVDDNRAYSNVRLGGDTDVMLREFKNNIERALGLKEIRNGY